MASGSRIASMYAEVGADVSSFTNGMNQVHGSMGSAKTALGNLKNEIPGLGSVMSLVTNPITLVGAGIAAVGSFAKAAVSDTLEYNKSIREMSQVTGMSSDELSRIVQVGDDWGISIDAIRTSLQFMNKQGITPSIDKLAEIADSYVNATNKSAWAAEAVKTLGRGYTTLIPVLQMGGDALREQAAAVDDSLIATEKSIKATREYEVAADNLGDAWQGFKNTIGNAIVPALADVMTGLNGVIQRNKEASDVVDQLRQAYELQLIPQEEYVVLLKNIREGTITAADAAVEYNDVLSSLETTTLGAAESERLYTIGRGALISSTEDLTAATDDYVTAEEAAKIEAELFDERLKNLNDNISGNLGPTIDTFNEKQGEITTRMEEVKVKIDELNAKQHLTPEQQSQLDTLQTEYDTLKSQYTANADEFDAATARIKFGILEQVAAMGGLTEDEINFLEQIATAWGLPDAATIRYKSNAQTAIQWLATHPGDTAGAIAILSGQSGAWSTVATQANTATTNVGTYHRTIQAIDGTVVTTYLDYIFRIIGGPPEGPPGGGGGGGGGTYVPPALPPPPGTGKFIPFQHGLDFVIPPGYPADTFPLNLALTSGEHIEVTPAPMGRKGRGEAIVIHNLVINTPAGTNGMQLFNQFEQALESKMRTSRRVGVPYSDY